MEFHLIENIIDKENDGICQNTTRSELSKMLMIISRYCIREGMYQCLMCSKSTLIVMVYVVVGGHSAQTDQKETRFLLDIIRIISSEKFSNSIEKLSIKIIKIAKIFGPVLTGVTRGVKRVTFWHILTLWQTNVTNI